MTFANYLGDFDVDAETSQVLDLALDGRAQPSGLPTTLRTE
jgi:hypothetical protein